MRSVRAFDGRVATHLSKTWKDEEILCAERDRRDERPRQTLAASSHQSSFLDDQQDGGARHFMTPPSSP